MTQKEYPYYLANRPSLDGERLDVLDKASGAVAARGTMAGERAAEQAVSAAVSAAGPCRMMASHARAAALRHVVTRLGERAEEFARALVVEVGKPICDARGEVDRAVDTFRIASEEATRIGGEYLRLDISPRADGCEAICKRVAVGPCVFITPFNFPLNLAAHKIAPAIAAGCSWVLKPASLTPITSVMLGEILAETNLPAGAFSILPCRREIAERLATDERFSLLSFTGSPDVGWGLKARAGRKKVSLELGGNAACIVDADADLERAVAKITRGAFYQAGQSCISVQRIFAHASIYEAFKTALVEAAKALRRGDLMDDKTFIGPLITEDEAVRVESWVNEAKGRGARALCGAKRDGAYYEPTLMEHVPTDAPLSCREVFGPVAVLERFERFEDACRRANESRYGLQAGVFTKRIDAAFYAFNTLEVGGVILNDVPAFRVDSMPYGGVKESGTGREGVRYAIEEMTERRLLVLSQIGRGA